MSSKLLSTIFDGKNRNTNTQLLIWLISKKRLFCRYIDHLEGLGLGLLFREESAVKRCLLKSSYWSPVLKFWICCEVFIIFRGCLLGWPSIVCKQLSEIKHNLVDSSVGGIQSMLELKTIHQINCNQLYTAHKIQ